MRPRSPIFPFVATATWVLLSLAAAAQSCDTTALVESIDSGNMGAYGALELATDSTPSLGGAFEARVTSGPPSAHGCVFFSLNESPYPLAEFDAVFHPTLPIVTEVFDFDATGAAEGLLAVSFIDPVFCGVTVVAQAITMDDTAPGGLGVSNALRVHIGGVPLPRYFYVHDAAVSLIMAYLTDESGVTYAKHPDAPFPTGGSSVPGDMDDSRRSLVEFDGVLYTANWGSHDISALRIEADGALTPLPGSPFSSGAFTPGSLDVHPSLPLLYVTHDAQDTLVTLAIAPDGSLSEAFPPLPTGVNENGLTNLAVHPSGQVLWASSRPHSEGGDYYKALHAFGIGADGAPTDLGTFAPAKPYANLVCTPSGDQLYAVTTRGQTTPTQPMGVYGFDVSLTPAIEYPVIDGSPFFNTAESIDVTKDLVTSVDGRFLFVYNTANPFNPASFTHIHTYAVEESGALTSLGVTEETGVFPVRILSVSADGTRLFTVGTTTNVYEIDADGGLTYLGSSPSYGISLHATGAVAVL